VSLLIIITVFSKHVKMVLSKTNTSLMIYTELSLMQQNTPSWMMSPEDLNSSNFKIIVIVQYQHCIVSFMITQWSICHVVRSTNWFMTSYQASNNRWRKGLFDSIVLPRLSVWGYPRVSVTPFLDYWSVILCHKSDQHSSTAISTVQQNTQTDWKTWWACFTTYG